MHSEHYVLILFKTHLENLLHIQIEHEIIISLKDSPKKSLVQGAFSLYSAGIEKLFNKFCTFQVPIFPPSIQPLKIGELGA